MPRSNTDRRIILIAAWLVGLGSGSIGRAQLIGSAPTRFVDVVELTDHDDQADIVVLFNCPLRYISHLPASEGSELRVQLQPLPTCNVSPGAQIAGELPPVAGGSSIIAAVRVDSDIGGQITLVFQWKKVERYVLVQGADPRSMRIRLVDRARGRGKVLVGEPADNVSFYAINLESQPKPLEPAAVTLAAQRFNVPVFVSQAVVDGETWYRLRLGPIDKRAEAERLLAAAAAQYPRAWLAAGDDVATTAAGSNANDAPLPAVERIGSDPALDVATRRRMLADARAALGSRDYIGATTLLTKLQRQPEFPERSQAQELLGLARERAGQLAHAKAEYEEYLRRYPKGEAAERLARRLQTLRAASADARTGTGGSSANTGWTFSGGVGQQYRFDGTRVDNTVPPGSSSTVPTSAQVTRQNSLYNDADLLARHRGERFDFTSRISAGFARNFADKINGDTRRVSVASVELADRTLGLQARLGRQSRNGDGVLGTFDGLYASYQWRPMLGVGVAAGFPVEQTDAGIVTRRRFEALALSLTPPGRHWSASMFGAVQQFEGFSDRRAVGLEARYLAAKSSVAALLDYDTSFRSLNAATILGTLQLPARWYLSFDAERRNSPVLTLRNALIGQPATSIVELQQVFTLAEINQLARDRTAMTSNYSVTASRPIGQRFQFTSTVAATRTDPTVDSGGVGAQPGTGMNLIYQTQLYASNLWRSGDFSVLSFTWASTEIGKTMSLGVTSRLPLNNGWRIGPRLSIDHRTLIIDDSTEIAFVPSLLLDYQRDRKLLQFEVGGQTGKRDALLQTQKLTRYYVSLAYRIGF
jgi:tetratricopeptide (TPR) repeat protein